MNNDKQMKLKDYHLFKVKKTPWVIAGIECLGRLILSSGVVHYGMNNIKDYGLEISFLLLLIWSLIPFYKACKGVL